ncbi:hypothetical protein ASE71_17445 [Ensifer sp. Root954]|nr:hypothetical protein ASE71_17445 [Ensifer sp. Root954]
MGIGKHFPFEWRWLVTRNEGPVLRRIFHEKGAAQPRMGSNWGWFGYTAVNTSFGTLCSV